MEDNVVPWRRQSSQTSVGSGGGSTPSPSPQIMMNGAGGESIGGGGGGPPPPPPPPLPPPQMGGCAPPPPPPPPLPGGSIRGQKLSSEIGPRKSNEPPSAIMNAMMTKDKKPFTYTPGGINLADIKSPRMARRVQKNAMSEGTAVQDNVERPQPTEGLPQAPPAPLQTPVQVIPAPPLPPTSQLPRQVVPVQAAAPPPPTQAVAPPPPQRFHPPQPQPPTPASISQPQPPPPQFLQQRFTNQPSSPPPFLQSKIPNGGTQASPVRPATPTDTLPSPTIVTAPIRHPQLRRVTPPPEEPKLLQQEIHAGEVYTEPTYNYNENTPPQRRLYENAQSRVSPPESDEVFQQRQQQQRRAQLGSLYIPPVQTKPETPQYTATPSSASSPPWRSSQPQLQQRTTPSPHQQQQQQQPQFQQRSPQQQSSYQQRSPQPQSQQRPVTTPSQPQQRPFTTPPQPQQQQPTYQPRILQVQREGSPPQSDRIFIQERPLSAGATKQPERYILIPREQPQDTGSSQHKERIIPIQIEGREGPSVNGSNPDTRPSQSRSFRILQMITDTHEDEPDTVDPDCRRLEMTDEDRQLMNMFKNQVDEDTFLHNQPDPRYMGSHIPSRAFRILQGITGESPGSMPGQRTVNRVNMNDQGAGSSDM